jgi:putative membrane protein
MQDTNGNLWKGAVAGLAAGLAATYVMTQFQSLSGKLAKALESDDPQNPQHAADRGKPESGQRDQGNGQEKQEEDATVKTAEAISRKLFHHELTPDEKKVAGPAVHYGFGALTGGVYGALAELNPAVTRGVGLPFGTAVWLGADEVAVPAFRLSGPPLSQPPSVHVRALAAHLVYGLATEATRRLVRRVL